MSAALRRVTGELCAARQRRRYWYSLYLRKLYPACKECFSTAIQAPEPEAPNRLPTRSLGVQFAEAAKASDIRGLKLCWDQYRQRGLPLKLWMFNSQISVHARRRELSQALQVFDSIPEHGLVHSASSYHALLHAYSKAGHPPYDYPPSLALEAEEVFTRMLQAGHTPDSIAYHWLMETQAKATLPDKVCETFNLLLKHGKTPDSYSLGALVDAYGRANQPLKAQQYFDTMTAEYGFTPTTTNWNALLGAYAKAGHKDGAYATWQKMVALKVVPDEISQRALALAFGGNPQMASALVKEAQQLQEAAPVDQRSSSSSRERQQFAGSKFQQHTWQMHAMSAPRGPFVLDLHGLSRPAARLALHNRLHYLAEHPELLKEINSLKPSLEVITGIGRNSFSGNDSDSMKTAVQNQLKHMQLLWQPGSNEGRVQVPYEALCQFVQQEQYSWRLDTFLHGASLRYLMVFGGVSGAFAATYVIPKLLTGL